MSKIIEFTKESAKLFVKDYNKARKANAESFFYNGDEYVIGYAYYLIQYLEMKKMVIGTFDDNKIFTCE